jgi:hypothetical protein
LSSPKPTVGDSSSSATARCHAQAIVVGDTYVVLADIVGNTVVDLIFGGAMPPTPTTRWEDLATVDAPDGQWHAQWRRGFLAAPARVH